MLDGARYGNSDLIMFNFATKPQAESDYEDVGPMSGQELMRTRNIHGSACCYLFRRNILGELRFTPGIYHEDEEFTPLLLLRAESVYQTTAAAYFYRKRPESITTAANMRHKLKRLDDLKAVIVRLNQTADTLRDLALFPLPDKDYTTKYTWFRRLTNSSAGLSLLMQTLPLLNREP